MATLKISELSIGDWVRWKVYDKPYDMQVSGVTDRRIYGLHDGIEYSMLLTQISPIPITAEMLEKNGFEENCGRWYNSEAIMEFEQYGDGWCRTINCGEYSVYSIKYVHQLQHALRLAGVDKEINL